ncbi:MAG: tetratricopeptide repeat protein, partial [Pyrinomonadaceae bacterium]
RTIEAVSIYQKVVKMRSDSIDYRYALGSLYWKLIRYQDAEREFLEILKRHPAEPRASFNLGDIYLTNGDGAKAIPFLEVSAKAFPDEFDTRFALGRAYISTKNYQSAIENLEIAVKLRPTIAESFYQLAVALQKSGRRAEARTAFNKARDLQNAKRQAEGLNNRQP